LSDTTNPNGESVLKLLELFFPQFFDPDSPSYVEEEILQQLNMIAMESRPWCLSKAEQNLAEAWFTAYLVSFRKNTSSGVEQVEVAGPIVSEREGDIAVSYASPSSGNTNTSNNKPPTDPYDAWKRMWDRCGMGSITTRYGDPVRRMSSSQVTARLMPVAVGVWHTWQRA
jgi:uncharacterized protein YnzC (UPF0291/DUF896 family)